MVYFLIFIVFIYICSKAFRVKKTKSGDERLKGSADEVEVTVTFSTVVTNIGRQFVPSSDDSDERLFVDWKAVDGLRLILKYKSASGEVAERLITVRKFSVSDGVAMLVAYCDLRHSIRSFRSDRVIYCADAETGEIVDDLPRYLSNSYKSSAIATKDHLFATYYDYMLILFYVAKADGQVRVEELQVIKGVCEALSGDERLTIELVRDLYDAIGRPTNLDFKKAVNRVKAYDDDARTYLLQSVVEIVQTQKAIHEDEQAALDFMRKAWLVKP